MFFLLLLMVGPSIAQVDLSAIRRLEDELPNYNQYKQSDEDIEITRQDRQFTPPKKIIPMEKILGSGTQMGAISSGSPLRDIESNKSYEVTKLIYVKYYNFEDENGYKYILNNDGSVKWRVASRFVEPIKEELSLYVPPLRYTPAPENIVRAEYDKKLSLPPEVSFYTGLVQGNYMQDLFEDNEARSGTSIQYGLHFFTQWKLPIKAGAVLHYEKTTYRLTDGGSIQYSSPSFGPQFKTKDFEFFTHPIRFQTQFRVSPFAQATANRSSGSTTFEFNSADLLASIERPVKNRFGEFVLGLYFQSQWLSIKNQEEFVNVRASNETNKSFGLSFSQVFQ